MSVVRDKTTPVEDSLNIENKPSVKHIVKLWKYVFSSAKVMCFVFMGLTILLSLIRPVMAFVWGKYVDQAAVCLTDTRALGQVAVLGILYYLLYILTDLLQRFTGRWEDIERLDKVQQNRFQEMINTRIYRKIGSLNYEQLESSKLYDRVQRVLDFTEDGWSGLNGSIMRPSYFVIARIVSVASIALSLYVVNPILCVVLLIAPVPVLYTTYLGNKLSFKFVKDNVGIKRKANYYQNLMLKRAVKEVKAFHLFDFFFAKWKTSIDEYTAAEHKAYVHRSFLEILNVSISTIASVAADIVAIVMMALGQISLGSLAAVMSLINTLIQDTTGLFESISSVISKKNESAMFFDLMDLSGEKEEREKLEEVNKVEAVNLSYRYPFTDRYVLDHVDLTIHRGEKIAFVGENGAGKTTFVKLLSGLLKPSDGDLRINGTEVERLNPSSRFEVLSSVPQDPARYTTFTVADNVRFGNIAAIADKGKISESLHFAGLEAMDENALLGKDVGGTDMSGGQWQKLAIARAYYRDKDFFILDEPTGNLDPLAEADVFQKYLDMAQDRTVIMVTHRISVASLAERIVVFAHGKIVEDGSHEQLLEQGGEYARLYKAQAQWYDR